MSIFNDDMQVGITMSDPMVRRIVGGNPGALNVVMRLQHRARWHEIMLWLDRNGYRGPDLWILYKDVFGERLFDLGDFLVYMMNSKHYREKYGPVSDLDLGLLLRSQLQSLDS